VASDCTPTQLFHHAEAAPGGDLVDLDVGTVAARFSTARITRTVDARRMSLRGQPWPIRAQDAYQAVALTFRSRA
jgi:hypothetical protein